MKRFFILLTLVNLSFYSDAQSNREITITEIGWTFMPPEGFKLMDSSIKTYKVSPEVDYWSKTIVLQKSKNLLTASISFFTNENELERERMYKVERNRSYNIATKQKPNLKLDSSTTIAKVGDLSFNKFTVSSKENGVLVYNHVELTKFYKGYKCMIVYNCIDRTIGDEIEKLLQASKFVK